MKDFFKDLMKMTVSQPCVGCTYNQKTKIRGSIYCAYKGKIVVPPFGCKDRWVVK